jgi:hypothetical protein
LATVAAGADEEAAAAMLGVTKPLTEGRFRRGCHHGRRAVGVGQWTPNDGNIAPLLGLLSQQWGNQRRTPVEPTTGVHIPLSSRTLAKFGVSRKFHWRGDDDDDDSGVANLPASGHFSTVSGGR